VVTLALCGQWQGFGSERGFYRYAQRHLRAAFPSLPAREQYNRQVRQQHAALVAFVLYLVRLLGAQRCAYEALDSSGVPTRDAKRRGAGWLPGLADIGWSNRLGWYEGVHLLLTVTPIGVITGFVFRSFRTIDRYSPGSTLKKKKGQTSDQCGAHYHSIGGLVHAKTSGLGPTVSQPGLCSLSADQPWQRERNCDLSDPEREATYLPVWCL
jgi:hypothetical protein